MTAEEFLITQGCQRISLDGKSDFFEDVQPIDLIEFAKYHVQEAAKAWALEMENQRKEGFFNANEVINAYPLENIK